MALTFLKRGIFQRIFGIPATPKPQDPNSWSYADGRLTLDLKRTPELDSAGGAVRLEGSALPGRVLLVRADDGTYRAFQNRCTHMGHRRLDPVPGTDTVQCCSVSRSTYDYAGKKIYGPAPEPIETYPVEMHEHTLIITVRP
ncbi:MAG: Rieske (2Fe-2S) protein [Deltaproteobacteria bacterium]|nr:Rieske (2Fe-2S) protein [Deltaproteobacteria bacterium]